MSGQRTALFKSDGECFSEFGQKIERPMLLERFGKSSFSGRFSPLFRSICFLQKPGKDTIPLSVILSNSRFRAQKSAYSQRLKTGAWCFYKKMIAVSLENIIGDAIVWKLFHKNAACITQAAHTNKAFPIFRAELYRVYFTAEYSTANSVSHRAVICSLAAYIPLSISSGLSG